MRIVLSGGGTAGHITPALAVAQELLEQGHEVLYAGTPTGVEAKLVKQAGLPFVGFEAAGFDRSRPLTLLSSVLKILKSSNRAKAWFKEVKPDAVVCFGGYVCIPVGRAAKQTGTALVVHEQNSVMGMANAYLAKTADAVCLTYGHAAKAHAFLQDNPNVQVTGNPVRPDVFKAQRDESRAALGIPHDALVLLVTGGSLGARHLNQAVAAMKDQLLANPDVYVIHVTGPKELDAVTQQMALTDEESQRWRLVGYTNQMGECMAAADAIVSRAGASSLAEISARALPALLVPFPFATADHQTLNAQSCVDAGAAFMVADADVEGEEFQSMLMQLIEDQDLRNRMRKAAQAQKTQDAAALVAKAVVEAAHSRGAAREQ